MLAQTQSMVREGKVERKRETELERKRGKKEAALGFASGRAHSSNIDSVLLFLFFFLPLLLRPHPPCPALSLPLRESYADPRELNQ